MEHSAAEFENALQQLQKPTPETVEFLSRHANAKCRAATASQLAEAAGYDGWTGINLRYGILAKQISDLLDEPDAGLSLLSKWIEPGQVTNSDYILIMRDEFADALARAGWVSLDLQ